MPLRSTQPNAATASRAQSRLATVPFTPKSNSPASPCIPLPSSIQARPSGYLSRLPARVDLDMRAQRNAVAEHKANLAKEWLAKEAQEMSYWLTRREFHLVASHALLEEARLYRGDGTLTPRFQSVHKDVDLLLHPADPVDRTGSIRRQIADLKIFTKPF